MKYLVVILLVSGCGLGLSFDNLERQVDRETECWGGDGDRRLDGSSCARPREGKPPSARPPAPPAPPECDPGGERPGACDAAHARCRTARIAFARRGGAGPRRDMGAFLVGRICTECWLECVVRDHAGYPDPWPRSVLWNDAGASWVVDCPGGRAR